MLTNADVRRQLRRLVETATRAEETLRNSDDVPGLELAGVAVDLDKLNAKAGKLADRISKLSAPLSAGNGQAEGESGEKPSRKGKRS